MTASVADRRGHVVARLGGAWTIATAGVWLAYRTVLVLGGARFSADFLEYGWQLVPVETLRDDPLRSVWYLHVQPPLFNGLVGAVLRWSPLPDALSLQLVMLACSLVLVVALQRLCLHLGLGPAAAFAVALFVSLDPELVRYEFGATYELPVATLVVVALLLAARYLEQPQAGRLAAVVAVLTAAVLTRSLLHPLWLVGFVTVLLVATRGRWRRRDVALVALLPLVAVGGWLVKNQVLFGDATLSSWFGMNLQRAVMSPVPEGALRGLLDDGTLSPASAVPPFTEYRAYEGLVAPCTPTHDHPAVAAPARANGVANFNYECYLDVYRIVGRDAWIVVRERPGDYLRGRVDALQTTLARSSYAPGLRVPVFERVERLYHLLLLDVPTRLSMAGWAFPLNPAGYLPLDVSVVLGALLAVQAGLAAVAAWRLLRGRGGPRTVLVLLASTTVLYVVVVGALFELGENMRFRATVHPLYLGLPLALAVREGVRLWRSREGAARAN